MIGCGVPFKLFYMVHKMTIRKDQANIQYGTAELKSLL